MRPWLQAVRPLAQLNLALPVLFGEAFAYYVRGELSVIGVLLAHTFALSAQPVIIFANDLADEFADGLREKSTVLAGGSRVLVEKKLTRAQLRRGMILAWVAHICVGLVASLWLSHWLPLFCAGLTLALTHAYCFAPLQLSYRALGGTVQGVGTGVVLPIVGSVLGAGELIFAPWMILLATFALGLASNWITSIPDADRDRLARKWSLAGRYGAKRAAISAGTLVFAVSLSGFSPHGGLRSDIMPWVSAICWLFLVLAVVAYRRGERNQVAATWALLSSVQVLWVGWCIVLICARS